MKKATCKELKGACEMEFVAETPEKMAEMSRNHGMEMMKKGDEAHLAAMEDMKKMSEEDQKAWYQKFVESFDSLPDAN